MKIDFRITDRPSDLSFSPLSTLEEEVTDIEGYFFVKINDWEYGFCHDRPLAPNETGLFSLITWFEQFLEVIRILNEGKAFAAISDIETSSIWLSFEKKDDLITVSEIETQSNKLSLDKKPAQFKRLNQAPSPVSFFDFKREVWEKTSKLIQELIEINPLFDEHFCVRNLRKLIAQTKEMKP
ncbi:MAG: hypothetical protein HYW48_10225 [Deltaproteobacteria bacterium]|nr:hypothetical protein [Deltaproteobacteria bacterium]